MCISGLIYPTSLNSKCYCIRPMPRALKKKNNTPLESVERNDSLCDLNNFLWSLQMTSQKPI